MKGCAWILQPVKDFKDSWRRPRRYPTPASSMRNSRSGRIISLPSPVPESVKPSVAVGGTGTSPAELEANFPVPEKVQVEVFAKQTQHPVGRDPWWVIGITFVVALNNAFALGYPYLILVPLGWYAGVGLWVGCMLLSYHCNALLASLHEYGGVRHVRHRDIAGHIYGPFMYKVVFFLQYINLLVGDVGLVILAGIALKAVYLGINADGKIHLGIWITITGAFFLLFAICVPHMHALRVYSGLSIAASATYTLIAVVIAIQNGLDSPPRDYSVQGTTANKFFLGLGALATIGFTFNTTMLPEIQSTVKAPTDTNMYKALRMQVLCSNPIFMGLGMVGYWAYGNELQPFLLASLRGPKNWITVAYAAAFLQAAISLHLYSLPVYEYIDSTFGRVKESAWSRINSIVRIVGRTSWMFTLTFLGALLPFFGDFVVISGAVAIWPLEFALANHMYLKVKTDLGSLQRAWHWMWVILTSLLTLATLTAGVRYVIKDSIYYKAFANL